MSEPLEVLYVTTDLERIGLGLAGGRASMEIVLSRGSVESLLRVLNSHAVLLAACENVDRAWRKAWAIETGHNDAEILTAFVDADGVEPLRSAIALAKGTT